MRVRIPRALLSLALAVLAACSTEHDVSQSTTPPPNVAVVTDLSQTFNCDARDCLALYRSFVTDHPQFAAPRPEAVVLAELVAIEQQPLPPVLSLGEAELRARIIDALNIGFMLEDFDARPLQVTIFADTEKGGIRARRLIFADPLVGEFEALQLEPAGSARLPAIIGLHGHFDSPAVFAAKFLGTELAKDGYLVLMPQFRAMNCIGAEDEISRTLISGGFNLMAMRVYESLLLLKYLRAVERVDAGHIGVLSHSGGSSTANLLVHLTERIAAQVTDYYVDWRDRCIPPPADLPVHCETVPGLFPLNTTLCGAASLTACDDASAPVPRMSIPYGDTGFATDAAAIHDFFAAHLGGES
jgi:dienelactone hydrolase